MELQLHAGWVSIANVCVNVTEPFALASLRRHEHPEPTDVPTHSGLAPIDHLHRLPTVDVYYSLWNS